MDKYLEYLESLKKSNPELLMPSNRAMLMKSMEEKFNIKIQSEEDLIGYATDRGFSFPEKKRMFRTKVRNWIPHWINKSLLWNHSLSKTGWVLWI